MAEALQAQKSDKIKWLVTILISVIILLIPCNEVFTLTMKKFFVITVFSLLCAAFEFFPNLVIGLMLPIGYIIFNVAPIGVVTAPWTQSMVFQGMGAFILAGIMQVSGLTKRISFWLMSKTGSNYTITLVAVYVTAAVLSAITFGGTGPMIGALCLGLCLSLDIMGTKMAAGIAAAAFIGNCTAIGFTYVISTWAMLNAAAQSVVPDFTVTFFDVYAHNWPMFFVALAIILIIAKWYKADKAVSGKEYFQNELAALGKMNKQEKSALIILGVMILALLTNRWHHIDGSIFFMSLPLLGFLPFFGFDAKGIIKCVPIDMMFFMTACMGIGNVATTLGFGAIFAQVIIPMLDGSNGLYFVFGLLLVVVFVANFLMTPFAIWGIVTAPLVAAVTAAGYNPVPFLYALVHFSDLILLPYEYVPYLMIFAFGMISMKDFIKISVVKCTVYGVGFFVVLIPYWYLIGLL